VNEEDVAGEEKILNFYLISNKEFELDAKYQVQILSRIDGKCHEKSMDRRGDYMFHAQLVLNYSALNGLNDLKYKYSKIRENLDDPFSEEEKDAAFERNKDTDLERSKGYKFFELSAFFDFLVPKRGIGLGKND